MENLVKEPNIARKKRVYIAPDGKSVNIDSMDQDDCNEAIKCIINKIEKEQRNINTLVTVYEQLRNHNYFLNHTVVEKVKVR